MTVPTTIIVLLLAYISLGDASYCSGLNIVIVGEKQKEAPWKATGSVQRTGQRYSDGSGSNEKGNDGMWNITVNVDQCRDSCESNPIVQINATATRSTPQPLPGYKVHRGIGNYKYYNKPANWYEARKICIDDGAHLAVINSEEEAQVIETMFAKGPLTVGESFGNTYFLGFHRNGNTDQFITIFDQPLSDSGYVKWAGGEPNDASDTEEGENCGSMYHGVGYNDLKCSSKEAFFCEQEISC